MKTTRVLIAGALFASMTLAAGSGPTMEERARVKYGRSAETVRPAEAAIHCPACERNQGAWVSARAVWEHVKFGRALPVPARSHNCCADGE